MYRKGLLIKQILPCCSKDHEPWECELSGSDENSRVKRTSDQAGHPLKRMDRRDDILNNTQINEEMKTL